MCQGVKEVTLLGQNVNSYRDTSEVQFCGSERTKLSRGFSTVYRAKQGGLRFSDLLDLVSRIDPDMRIRFTSPHPKDFPDEVRPALEVLSAWKCVPVDFLSNTKVPLEKIIQFC